MDSSILVAGVDFARYLNTSYLDGSETEPRPPPNAASAAAAAAALAAGLGAPPRELQRCLLGGSEVDPDELHRGRRVVRHTGAEASVIMRSSAELVCTTPRLGSAGLQGALSLDFDEPPGAEAAALAGGALELRGSAAAGSGVLALGGTDGGESTPQWGGAVLVHGVQVPPLRASDANPNPSPNPSPSPSPNPSPS